MFPPGIWRQTYDSATFIVICQCRLPANGVSLIQAQQIGAFIYLWFRRIDVHPGLFEAQFDGSVLGSCLKHWPELPAELAVHQLWLDWPSMMTFQWFDMLCIYLRPFKQLLKSADYKIDYNYINQSDHLLAGHSSLTNGSNFLKQVCEANTEFNSCWR